MSRRRDHRVRMDATHCPDWVGCARLYHGTLGGPDPGDTCECCGAPVLDPVEAEAVRATLTGGNIVYWRYRRPGETRWVGAVRKTDDGRFRALGYALDGRRPPNGNVELGMHPDRGAGEVAVQTYAATGAVPLP